MSSNENELKPISRVAGEFGLSKAAIKAYCYDEHDPLPHRRSEDGTILVCAKDVKTYLENHPNRGRPKNSQPDRIPANGDTTKQYYTLSDAAKASGYTVPYIRRLVTRAANPLAHTRNKDGWILIEQTEFWEFMETKGAKHSNDEASACPPEYDPEAYPELMELPGTYQTPRKLADALNLPIAVIRSWIDDPFRPVEHFRNGNRVYLNKHRVAEYLQKQEVKDAIFTRSKA